MKKFLSVLLICAMVLSLAACGDSSKKSTSAVKSSVSSGTTHKPHKEVTYAKGTFPINAENAKLIGRTYVYRNILWCVLSGTGCEFNLTAKTCEIMLRGDANANVENHSPRFAIYVDGKEVVKKNMDAAVETVKVFEESESAAHVVRVVKLSEASDSTMGIVKVACDEEATIAPTEAKKLKMEFIGDSITCGYGVDEALGGSYKTSNEDCTKAYAVKTANLLDAEYSLVSFSGYGIISGYTSGDKNTVSTLPQHYDKLGNSDRIFIENERPKDVVWDFSYVPDIVVLNLGTNDDSYCGSDAAKQDEYEKAYVDFIKLIREKNPKAKIICTLGLMGNRLYPRVENAVNQYKTETGDAAVYSFALDVQDSTKGYAVDYHPVEANHEHAAQQLAEFINTLN